MSPRSWFFSAMGCMQSIDYNARVREYEQMWEHGGHGGAAAGTEAPPYRCDGRDMR